MASVLCRNMEELSPATLLSVRLAATHDGVGVWSALA